MNPRITAAARAVVGAALGLGASLAFAVGAGEPAPDFRLDGTGGPVQLSAQQGRVVFLDFWASWCGPCKQSFPWMNDLQARFGPQGLQVIAVSVDAHREDARRFLTELPARFTVAFDPRGETPRRYDIPGMPTSVLIGPDGKVLHVHSGFRPEERAALEARIGQALAALPRTATP